MSGVDWRDGIRDLWRDDGYIYMYATKILLQWCEESVAVSDEMTVLWYPTAAPLSYGLDGWRVSMCGRLFVVLKSDNPRLLPSLKD